MLRAQNRFLQGYNAQAARSEDQVMVASELTSAADDSTMFAWLVKATEAAKRHQDLDRHERTRSPSAGDGRDGCV
jgi:hypothetical protein